MGMWWLYKWYWLTYGILGFLVFFSGVASGNVVAIAFGAVFLFAATSAFLTGYVEGEHGVKSFLEVVFAMMVFGVLFYGYIQTGSFILGVITLFLVAMVLFAFVVTYLLPRIRGNREGKNKRRKD